MRSNKSGVGVSNFIITASYLSTHQAMKAGAVYATAPAFIACYGSYTLTGRFDSSLSYNDAATGDGIKARLGGQCRAIVDIDIPAATRYRANTVDGR